MNYKIFDAHSHIKIEDENDCSQYVEQHLKNKIKNSIVMVDPFLKNIKCPENSTHYVNIKEKEGMNQLFCTVCGKEIGSPFNIYRNANEELLRLIQKVNQQYDTKFYPFITTAVSESMLHNELTYFEQKFPKQFYGIKIYTGLSHEILSNVRFSSKQPLLIHTALKYENQHPKNMINFILNYEGPVLLAHFARLDKMTIRILKEKEDVFFDSSPAKMIFERFHKNREDGIKSPEELYYQALELIGSDRLLWGTDYPYGDIEQELELFHCLRLDKKEIEKILYYNAQSFLHLNDK